MNARNGQVHIADRSPERASRVGVHWRDAGSEGGRHWVERSTRGRRRLRPGGSNATSQLAGEDGQVKTVYSPTDTQA